MGTGNPKQINKNRQSFKTVKDAGMSACIKPYRSDAAKILQIVFILFIDDWFLCLWHGSPIPCVLTTNQRQRKRQTCMMHCVAARRKAFLLSDLLPKGNDTVAAQVLSAKTHGWVFFSLCKVTAARKTAKHTIVQSSKAELQSTADTCAYATRCQPVNHLNLVFHEWFLLRLQNAAFTHQEFAESLSR